MFGFSNHRRSALIDRLMRYFEKLESTEILDKSNFDLLRKQPAGFRWLLDIAFISLYVAQIEGKLTPGRLGYRDETQHLQNSHEMGDSVCEDALLTYQHSLGQSKIYLSAWP